jgi:hypothetical protein
MISCKNTLTPRKKLSQKTPLINQRKRQQEERKTMMAPQRRKRGNRRGKKKLLDLHRVVLKKEKELIEVARHLGPKNLLKQSKSICESLTSKEENLREKTGKEKSKQLI